MIGTFYGDSSDYDVSVTVNKGMQPNVYCCSLDEVQVVFQWCLFSLSNVSAGELGHQQR